MKNKYILDYINPCLFVLSLAIVCGVCYKKGKDSVKNEAIGLGYAKMDQGRFMWKSRRAIERGE